MDKSTNFPLTFRFTTFFSPFFETLDSFTWNGEQVKVPSDFRTAMTSIAPAWVVGDPIIHSNTTFMLSLPYFRNENNRRQYGQ